ncbi:hypothetical protein UFOVP787_31 [uncultured Caudovirales phage]|uniref:Cytidyltransferase-like domain containing protein n=1 Tax=uncultured Caudovirales phage TaxID=2100421 RepID=A0A6J5NYP4_9CAUD|nr:hypothetical protein UFOVP787_31 [uncultured Caudovirales phage]
MRNFNNYLTEAVDKTTHVMTFMRANPPTVGHQRVVNLVKQLGKDYDADHSVVLSHSYDGDKNPLTPDQKLRHAKAAFPSTNVKTSSEKAPTLMHHLSELHGKGVRNLHLVVGQDRVDQFKDLINKYNGKEGPHGYFNFQNIKVHSAGGRDPDAEGIEGVSGTGQRKHAMNNDFDSFRAGAPSHMSDEQAMSLMHDVRNSMLNPPAKKTKKKLKEQTTTSSVGGLGFNTGNPSISKDYLSSYITDNSLATDNENGSLINMLKKTNSIIAGRMGFKAFEPKPKGKK